MSIDPLNAIPRPLRRDIGKAGLEEAARLEINAAIEEAVTELEPLTGRRDAETIARRFIPEAIATAVLLPTRLQELEDKRRRIEAQISAVLSQPVPVDAPPEEQVVDRVLRRRFEAMVTQYLPKEI